MTIGSQEEALTVDAILGSKGGSLCDRAKDAADERRRQRENKAREDEYENVVAALRFLARECRLEEHELPAEGDFRHVGLGGGERASIVSIDGVRLRFHHKRVQIGRPSAVQFQSDPIYDYQLVVYVYRATEEKKDWKEIKNLADLGEVLNDG